jgi:hypothetical protein
MISLLPHSYDISIVMNTNVTIIDVVWPQIWIQNGWNVPCACVALVVSLYCNHPVVTLHVPTIMLSLVYRLNTAYFTLSSEL